MWKTARSGSAARARRCGVLLVAGALVAGLSPTAAADPAQVSSDPAVVRDWNAIAWRTIGVEAGHPPQVAQLYLAFVSTAVYNAVVTVEGGGSPTLPQPRAHAHASSDVAAATAAYEVLRHFFPASADALQSDYDGWLTGVPEGVGRVHGLRVGHAAAAAFIASRQGDGRDAPIDLPDRDQAGPGEWVPTSGVEFQAPWLGFTRPVLVDSATQFTVDGPDAVTSPAYAADFEEVRRMGAAAGSDRSPADEATARFFSDNPPRQYQDAMRERSARHGQDIVATARMFAAANVAGADALITCWRVKYDANFWRPVTAIHQAGDDGNPATTADPGWQPLLGSSPPYPEYPSGHACISAGVARALENLFGKGAVDMDIRNAASGTVRHYDTEQAWLDEVVDARIWLGIHFRDAMDDGRSIGRQVADSVVAGWFAVTP